MNVIFRETDETAAGEIARACRIHPVVSRILVARGIADCERAHRFLAPRLADLRIPEGLAGLPEALNCLERAVRERQTVGIFGDYDVDGVSSAAVLATYLRALQVATVVRVARRESGYGFHAAAAEDFAQAGVHLVVTLDCGTSDHASIAALRARGIDVVVIDHHQIPDGESPSTALLNPHRRDSTFAFRDLCSAGLAFYVCAALRTRLGRDQAPDARELLDLVALGTIADMAPLLDENRILVAQGLRAMALNRRPGLAALREHAELTGAPRAEDVAFRLAPRLNAPGRLGQAQPALDCLMAADAGEAMEHAKTCDERNRERQALQDQVEIQARAQAEADDRPFLLLAGEGWHPGVVGIVAQRIVERFGRPTAVVGLESDKGDTGRGSARTVDGVDLYDLLSSQRDQFVRLGGHRAACGFTVQASMIEQLRESLSQATTARQPDGPAPRTTTIDAKTDAADLTLTLADDLARLEPFGMGNREPTLLVEDAEITDAKVVGKSQSHLQLRVRCGSHSIGAIGFGMATPESLPAAGARGRMIFRLESDEYQGVRRARMRLEHVTWR